MQRELQNIYVTSGLSLDESAAITLYLYNSFHFSKEFYNYLTSFPLEEVTPQEGLILSC